MVGLFRFTKHFESMPSGEIWNYLSRALSMNVVVKSIRDNISYTIHSVDEEQIVFSALSRNNGEPDKIERHLLEDAIIGLQKMIEFNTSLAKEVFKGGFYRRRSPIFAILLSTKIIEHQKHDSLWKRDY